MRPDKREPMKCESANAANIRGDAAPPDARSRVAIRRQVRSDDLFGGSREVLIEHAGAVYSLRHTSKGKLILTK